MASVKCNPVIMQVILIIGTGHLENQLKHACSSTLNTENFPSVNIDIAFEL